MNVRVLGVINGCSEGAAACITGTAIVLIAALDYATGIELRIYPLYYVPVAFVAWRFGRKQAIAASALCGLIWLGSNYLAGPSGTPVVWFFNFAVQVLSFAVIAYLVTSLKIMVQHEQSVSRTDALTSLLNARGFAEEAAPILDLAIRYRHPLTLAYIDLDDFKAVNDAGGHAAGDEVLRTAAKLIREGSRRGDIAARLGGDEFALLLPETGLEAASVVLNRIRARAESALNTRFAAVTTSIGAVACESPPRDMHALLNSADSAMYKAKSAGKNRVHIGTHDA